MSLAAECDPHDEIVELARSPEFIETLKSTLYYQRMALSKTVNPSIASSLRRTRINVIESMLAMLKDGAA